MPFFFKRFLSFFLMVIVATSPLQAAMSAIELSDMFHHDVVEVEDHHDYEELSSTDTKEHCHIEFTEQAHCHHNFKLSDSSFHIDLLSGHKQSSSRLTYLTLKASFQSHYPSSPLKPPRT